MNPGTRLLKDPSYPGIADDYRHALDVLASLEPDIFLTAHPEASGFDAKRARAAKEGVRAFVDREGYGRYVASQRARFEELLAKESPQETRRAGDKLHRRSGDMEIKR